MQQTQSKTGNVSRLLSQLNESATLAMARLSRELAAQGHPIVSLSLGEPDFNTPDFIKDAAKNAIDNNITHYPPVNGIPEVRKAIAAKFKRDNGLDYSPEQIVISTGAKQAIANTIYALVNPGDEVIMPSPFWVSYAEMVRLVGGVPVMLPAPVEQDFKITAKQLEQAINEKTKLIIYSSPCNPTGSVYSREELEAFAHVIEQAINEKTKLIIYSSPCNPTGSVYSREELEAFAHVIEQKEELYVISDEIYEHINFSGRTASIASIGNMMDRTITVNGVSKAFAMTGWRIGFIGAPKWIADACNKMQGQITSGANSIAQMATKAAMEADPEVIQPMIDTFRKRRDLVYDLLKEIPGIKLNKPEGAFYFFPDVSSYFGKSDGEHTIKDATDLSMYLLRTQHVALVTGDAFGDANCIRISYATSEDTLKEAIRRIAAGLANLK